MTSLSYGAAGAPRRLRTTVSFVLASVLAFACGSGDVADPRDENGAEPDAADDSASEGGSPLGDACSDSEWRALTVPLAVVRVDSATSRRHVVIDVDGRCRRWVDATDVLLSPEGRTLAYPILGGSSIALA